MPRSGQVAGHTQRCSRVRPIHSQRRSTVHRNEHRSERRRRHTSLAAKSANWMRTKELLFSPLEPRMFRAWRARTKNRSMLFSSNGVSLTGDCAAVAGSGAGAGGSSVLGVCAVCCFDEGVCFPVAALPIDSNAKSTVKLAVGC